MQKRTKRPLPVDVPRLGPPTNLRPAGAHTDKRKRSRAEEKAALRKAAFDSTPVRLSRFDHLHDRARLGDCLPRLTEP